MADELEFYLNCNTCSEIVSNVKKAPNDELLVNFFVTAGANACSAVLSLNQCMIIGERFKENFGTHFF
jgi:hypothetical protein